MVQMDVHGGNYDFVMIMLDFCQRFLNVLRVVVVNQCDCAGNLSTAGFMTMLHELRAHHVRDGGGTVVVSLLLYHFVVLTQQFLW